MGLIHNGKKTLFSVLIFFILHSLSAQTLVIPYYEAKLIKSYEVTNEIPLFFIENTENQFYLNELAGQAGSRDSAYPTSYMLGNSLFIRTIFGTFIEIDLDNGLFKTDANNFSNTIDDPGYARIPSSNREEEYYYNNYTYSLLLFNKETKLFENCLTQKVKKLLLSSSRGTYTIPIVINDLIIFSKKRTNSINENLLVVKTMNANGTWYNEILQNNKAASLLSDSLITMKEHDYLLYAGIYYPFLDYGSWNLDLTFVTTSHGDIPYALNDAKFLGWANGFRYYFLIDRILILPADSNKAAYRFAIHFKLNDKELITDFNLGQTLDFHVTSDGTLYCFYCNDDIAALYKLDLQL